jgi:Flp pilus assembly protein TadB
MDTPTVSGPSRALRHLIGIECCVLAIIVTIAWMNEPTSLARLGLACACWAPLVYGASLWLRDQWRSAA